MLFETTPPEQESGNTLGSVSKVFYLLISSYVTDNIPDIVKLIISSLPWSLLDLRRSICPTPASKKKARKAVLTGTSGTIEGSSFNSCKADRDYRPR
jgi:hypothetical protein